MRQKESEAREMMKANGQFFCFALVELDR
jgi:hypothetical protein